MLFDISVHLGSVLAVLAYFSREVIGLMKGVLPGTFNKKDAIVILCIFITTAFTGTIGLVLRHPIESLFSCSKLAATMLLVTGCLTFLIDRMGAQAKAYGTISIKDALVIGLFQAIALVPGISRSATTIFAGIRCGMERTWAASYSFIASIPVIMGAAAVGWVANSHQASALYLVGGATAFIVGLISLKFLVWTLKRNTFFIFSLYCWLVGLTYLAFFDAGKVHT